MVIGGVQAERPAPRPRARAAALHALPVERPNALFSLTKRFAVFFVKLVYGASRFLLYLLFA